MVMAITCVTFAVVREVSHLREPDRTVSVGLDVYGMADAITR